MTSGRGRWLVLAVVLAVAMAAAWRYWPRGERAVEIAAGREPIVRIVPDSLRIKVEVLNASGIRGQARIATFYLRDLGFDVVSSGNASERVDSTLVLVHGGRDDWAELLAQGLGGARIAARPDTSRYLDLTVLLGPDWRPPPQAFYP